MSEPVQLLQLSNDNFQKQISELLEKAMNDILTNISTTDTSQLAAKVDALNQKLDCLINFLEKWANVGNLTMRDIKEYV